jgi:hypothetical protein
MPASEATRRAVDVRNYIDVVILGERACIADRMVWDDGAAADRRVRRGAGTSR